MLPYVFIIIWHYPINNMYSTGQKKQVAVTHNTSHNQCFSFCRNPIPNLLLMVLGLPKKVPEKWIMTGPLCSQTTPTGCRLISSKFKWSPDAQQMHQCSFWFPPTYMWWLTRAKTKGTAIQCASTGVRCGCLIKEMPLLKAEVVTAGTCTNVLHSQSLLFMKQFAFALTNFYHNFLALSLQQEKPGRQTKW